MILSLLGYGSGVTAATCIRQGAHSSDTFSKSRFFGVRGVDN
jgi:hypothetical protein